jgi:hypothetical protein
MTTKEVHLYKNVPTFRIIWRGARMLVIRAAFHARAE